MYEQAEIEGRHGNALPDPVQEPRIAVLFASRVFLDALAARLVVRPFLDATGLAFFLQRGARILRLCSVRHCSKCTRYHAQIAFRDDIGAEIRANSPRSKHVLGCSLGIALNRIVDSAYSCEYEGLEEVACQQS